MDPAPGSAPCGGHDRLGLDGSPKHERERRPERHHAVGDVHHAGRVAVEPELLTLLTMPTTVLFGVIASVERAENDLASDRILTGPLSPGERFVDHHDRGSLEGIRLRQQPAADQPKAHGFELRGVMTR